MSDKCDRCGYTNAHTSWCENETLRAQLSALTEELREERAKPERYRDAENRHLRSKLSITTEERDRLMEWKRVIIDANVVGWSYTKEHEDNPQKALSDLLAIETQYALDPAVSSAAAKLRDTYKYERDRYREAMERLADAPVLCFDNTSGWAQSCRECEKKKADARSALSLSPLPEREAERESIGQLREELAWAYIQLSGRKNHASDCATSNAPAMDPGPCDCAPSVGEAEREVIAAAEELIQAWGDVDPLELSILSKPERAFYVAILKLRSLREG